MNPRSIEELFERNADMRLLELRHGEPGRSAGALRAVPSLPVEDAGAPPPVSTTPSPRLRVAIAAAPASNVIAGASVGIAIDVFNDGDAPAPESTLQLSLPLEGEYRVGTLRVDGREVLHADRLFGEGLSLGRLPGGASTKVIFQLLVLPGVNALYLQPRLVASNVPIVGTPGLSIRRATTPAATGAPLEAPTPFYELEPDEQPAVEAEGALPILPPVEPPPPPEPPAVVPDEVAEATVEPIEPEAPAESATAPAPAVDERMVLHRTLGPNDVALLARLFAVDAPGIVAHYLTIATIACIESDEGELPAYASFLQADAESLGRALVLARLGKGLTYTVAQPTLDQLDLPWRPTAPHTAKRPSARPRLRRELRPSECTAVGNLMRPSQRDPQLRLRIALLALAGATVENVPRAAAAECALALSAYRSAVLAWLVPLCVASGSSARAAVATAPAAADVAGRRLAAALVAAHGGS